MVTRHLTDCISMSLQFWWSEYAEGTVDAGQPWCGLRTLSLSLSTSESQAFPYFKFLTGWFFLYQETIKRCGVWTFWNSIEKTNVMRIEEIANRKKMMIMVKRRLTLSCENWKTEEEAIWVWKPTMGSVILFLDSVLRES